MKSREKIKDLSIYISNGEPHQFRSTRKETKDFSFSPASPVVPVIVINARSVLKCSQTNLFNYFLHFLFRIIIASFRNKTYLVADLFGRCSPAARHFVWSAAPAAACVRGDTTRRPKAAFGRRSIVQYARRLTKQDVCSTLIAIGETHHHRHPPAFNKLVLSSWRHNL